MKSLFRSQLALAESGEISCMIHEVEAIYDYGAFRPLTPLSLAEGALVHLRVEENSDKVLDALEVKANDTGRIRSPRLAHPEQADEFKMEVVIEATDAGV